jgi:argininosuccinate lyase
VPSSATSTCRDELAGISAAMPQKKNFPILERIRGRSAHLISFGLDLAVAQRATPYSNMVEVSKEAGAHLWRLFDTLRSTMRLFTTVLAHLRLRTDRMRAACEREYLGGFTLANLLTLHAGLPWRTAQVIAGRYVVEAGERGLPPSGFDATLLATLATAEGFELARPDELLAEAFDVDAALRAKQSDGSTNPDAVRHLPAKPSVSTTRWRCGARDGAPPSRRRSRASMLRLILTKRLLLTQRLILTRRRTPTPRIWGRCGERAHRRRAPHRR